MSGRHWKSSLAWVVARDNVISRAPQAPIVCKSRAALRCRHLEPPGRSGYKKRANPEQRMSPPRVAILGLMLESNRWSRPAGRDDFERSWLEGQAILDEARKTNTAMA